MGRRGGGTTIAACPVLRGNETAQDKHVPFNWQVLSKLQQLAAKHGLGCPAVANMLQFITVSKLTPFDMKQIAKLLFTLVQDMILESA